MRSRKGNFFTSLGSFRSSAGLLCLFTLWLLDPAFRRQVRACQSWERSSFCISQMKKLRDQNILVKGGENLKFGDRRTVSNCTDAHQQVTPLQASVYSPVARGLERHHFLAAYGTWFLPETLEIFGMDSINGTGILGCLRRDVSPRTMEVADLPDSSLVRLHLEHCLGP